jgi:hypothetical protein
MHAPCDVLLFRVVEDGEEKEDGLCFGRVRARQTILSRISYTLNDFLHTSSHLTPFSLSLSTLLSFETFSYTPHMVSHSAKEGEMVSLSAKEPASKGGWWVLGCARRWTCPAGLAPAPLLSWPHPLLPAAPSDDRASAPAVPPAPRRAVPSSRMTYSQAPVDASFKKKIITTQPPQSPSPGLGLVFKCVSTALCAYLPKS